MALAGSAARRYAEALLDLATQRGSVSEYRIAVATLRTAFDRTTLRVLAAPNIPLAQRQSGAERSLEGMPADIAALVRLLIQRGRIELLPEIATAFDDLVDVREGIVHARVTTAIELEDPTRRDYLQRLERATGKRVRARFDADPSLIGGARIQVGDHLIDASVRAQLDALRARLAG